MRIGYAAMVLSMVLGFGAVSGCDDDGGGPAASIEFCHALSRNGEKIVMTVQVSQGDDKTTFKAATDCCTPCASIKAGVPVTFVLSDDSGELYRTKATVKDENDYILMADILEAGSGPTLGLSDLTGANRTCKAYTPPAWGRCGSVD